MSTFDPKQYIKKFEQPEEQKDKPATKFDASKYVNQFAESEAPELTAASTAGESKSKLDEQLEESKAGYVTIPELKDILERNQLPAEDLEKMKEFAVFYGTKVPGYTGAKQIGIDVLGFLGELTGSFAQKASVWKQPKEAQAALDELRELAERRKTTGRAATEVASSMLLPAGAAGALAKTARGALAVGAASSVGQQVARSKSGKELEGVTEAITTGMGATGMLMGLSRLVAKVGKDGTKEVVDASTGRIVPKEQLKEAQEISKRLEDVDQGQKIKMIEAIEDFNERPQVKEQLGRMSEFLNEWDGKEPAFDAWYRTVTGKVFDERSFQQDAKMTRLLTKEQAKQLKRIGDEVAPKWWLEEGGSGANYLAYQNFQKELGSLQRRMGAANESALAAKLSEEGPEFLSRQYQRERESKHLKQYIRKNRLAGLEEWSQFRKGANQLIDVKPLARQFDNKFGSSFELTIDSISEKLNRVSYLRAGALGKLGDLRKVSNQAGVEPEDIFAALESGNANREIPASLYGQWRKYFDGLLDSAQELGLPIQRRENYAPNLRPDAVVYSDRLQKLYDGLGDRAKEALTGDSIEDYRRIVGLSKAGKKIKTSEAQAARMLASEMETLLGEFPKDAQAFRRMYSTLRNPQNSNAVMDSRARSAIARTEEGIPDYFKETNIYELAKQYTSNTFRHAAIRDEVAQLEQFKRFAEDQGDTWTVDYVNKLQQDILGTRTDVLGKDGRRFIKKAEIRLNEVADELEAKGNPLLAKQARRLTYLPEVYQMMSQSIYPNLLGLSPRAAFQNAISSPIMNIPELGANYGGRLATKAAAKAVRRPSETVEVTPELVEYLSAKLKLNTKMTDSKRAKLDKMVEGGLLKMDDSGRYAFNVGASVETSDADVILGSQGILPAQWTGELVSQLRNELKSSATYQASADVVEKWTQGSMAFFEASEKLARMQTYHLANEVADDLVAGRSGAKSWLENISSPAYSRAIGNALEEGNEVKVKRLTQRYFQSTNMFNYDRANMSAYGRYMGPLFSTFTKWPTAIAGRIVQELYDRGGKGAKKLGAQLIAPFMLAAGVDAMLPTQDESPQRSLLLGQGGLKAITPGSSIGGFVRGEFATPPVAQASGAVLNPLMDLDEATPGKVSKALQRGATMFVPGANILKLTGETIPQLMGINVRKENRSKPYKGRGKLEQQALRTIRALKGTGRR